jgi:hypothetical protein
METSDGDAGLSLAQSVDVDAIVIDVALSASPSSDTISHKLTKNSATKGIPVVLLTNTYALNTMVPPVRSKSKDDANIVRRVLDEGFATAERLRMEIKSVIGDNPPEYCTSPILDCIGIIPSRSEIIHSGFRNIVEIDRMQISDVMTEAKFG